jgi:hypothetical protein
MRGDQTIRCVPQRIVARQRLWISNVESRAADLLGLKGLDEGCLIDYLSARNVGNVSARRVGGVENLELGCRDEVVCCFAKDCQ